MDNDNNTLTEENNKILQEIKKKVTEDASKYTYKFDDHDNEKFLNDLRKYCDDNGVPHNLEARGHVITGTVGEIINREAW